MVTYKVCLLRIITDRLLSPSTGNTIISDEREDAVRINQRIAKYSSSSTIILAIFSNLTCFLFVSMPIVKIIYSMSNNGSGQAIRELPFQAV